MLVVAGRLPLTEQGAQVARQMALSGDEDAPVLLDALLTQDASTLPE